MEIPGWLAVSGAVVGLCGGTAGLISSAIHAFSFRSEKTDALRNALSRAWTNEGAKGSKDTVLMTLDLKMKDGDVFGSLQTTTRQRLLNANLEAHLTSATLKVSESTRVIATVRLRLMGNRNRVKWKVVSGNSEKWLPDRTILWPSEVGVDSWRNHGRE